MDKSKSERACGVSVHFRTHDDARASWKSRRRGYVVEKCPAGRGYHLSKTAPAAPAAP